MINLMEELLIENFRLDETKNIIIAGDVNMCQNKSEENSTKDKLQKLITNHNLIDLAREIEGNEARPTFYPKILTHKPSRLETVFINREIIDDNIKAGIEP